VGGGWGGPIAEKRVGGTKKKKHPTLLFLKKIKKKPVSKGGRKRDLEGRGGKRWEKRPTSIFEKGGKEHGPLRQEGGEKNQW